MRRRSQQNRRRLPEASAALLARGAAPLLPGHWRKEDLPPVYKLGNGNDYFNSQDQPDWASNSAIFGGNGDDTLISLGGGSGMGPGATLTGGLGRDAFILESDTVKSFGRR